MAQTPPEGAFLRNAVAIFEDAASLLLALDTLGGAGIDDTQISLVALEPLVPAERNGLSWEVFRSSDGSGPSLASTGFLAADLRRLLATAEHGLAPTLSAWLPRPAALFLERALDAGQIVLWVNLCDAAQERQVCGLLLELSRNTVQVHDLRIGNRV